MAVNVRVLQKKSAKREYAAPDMWQRTKFRTLKYFSGSPTQGIGLSLTGGDFLALK